MCLFNRLKCANKCRLINLGDKQKNETFEFFDLSVQAKVYAAEARLLASSVIALRDGDLILALFDSAWTKRRDHEPAWKWVLAGAAVISLFLRASGLGQERIYCQANGVGDFAALAFWSQKRSLDASLGEPAFCCAVL